MPVPPVTRIINRCLGDKDKKNRWREPVAENL